MKAIPRSKAKTAYGLISDVRRAILAEPKRVNMAMYCYQKEPHDGGPACGTVGCFAGWVLLLSGESAGKAGHASRVFPTDAICTIYPDDRAKRILGAALNYRTKHGGYVFDGGHDDDAIEGQPGTVTYARNVAKRITYFQKVNAKALKARRLA